MDVFEKVKEITAEVLRIDPEIIQIESDFRKDFEADSIDLFELVMAMEDAFEMELEDEAVESIQTVQDVVNYVQMKM
ncbi:MAG: acyl carrier protein [Firmicutes bacterium]|jgi:acyl carrier protein|nr:acyl carrier protein [Bacillota bacterium]